LSVHQNSVWLRPDTNWVKSQPLENPWLQQPPRVLAQCEFFEVSGGLVV